MATLLQILMTDIQDKGFATVGTQVPMELREALRESVFNDGEAGKRDLLDHPLVERTARNLRAQLVDTKVLPSSAIAIQAIAFDKSSSRNWKIAWHQDLMFPFANPASSPGYLAPTVKDGVHYAQPPPGILNDLLAVRLHLDDCDSANGPLRVVAGSHRLGVLSSDSVAGHVHRLGQSACLASEGEALLMKPLVLHASSQATRPKHRRVLHFVFHSGAPMDETWAHTV